jgi:hypothetical protein
VTVKETAENVIGKGKPGPGRPKGLPNKNRQDIMALAQVYGPACIEGIAKLMEHKNPGIRLAACKEMLDRGYGKAPQAADLNSTGNVYVAIANYSGRLMSEPFLAPYRPITALTDRPALINGSGNGSGSNGSEPDGSSDPAAE